MKHIHGVFLLSVLLIGLLFMAGCTSSTPESSSTPVATPTPQVVITMATPTAAVTIPTQVIATPTIPSMNYSADQVDSHFMDIAFTSKSQTLGQLSATGNKVAIIGVYSNDDVNTLSSFLQEFNTLSPAAQLPTTPIQSGTSGDITLNFLPESTLNNLAQQQPTVGQVNKESNGEIASIYETATSLGGNATYEYTKRSGTVVINNNLNGDERTHYMILGLLYYLGFVGQTTTYKDSIFYAGQNNITMPNGIDWQAIDLMYAGNIMPGMTYNNVNNVLHGLPVNTGF
ncbi:MAG: DUF2927 domain-containing protein [Methanoregula sp.]|uniref:DUF2927 domain-containing protein n=2 Tax=Methanoregula sp. TaxID=2052170 RepID=UPI003BB0E5B0